MTTQKKREGCEREKEVEWPLWEANFEEFVCLSHDVGLIGKNQNEHPMKYHWRVENGVKLF